MPDCRRLPTPLLRGGVAWLLLTACSAQGPRLDELPRVVIHYGEVEPAEPRPASSAAVASGASSAENSQGAPPQAAPGLVRREEPDPEATRTDEVWSVELAWDRGELKQLQSEARHLAQPKLTPRRPGRFALEAYEHGELRERLRFDFPLLAAGKKGADFENGLRTTARLEFPNLGPGLSYRVVDRRTEREWELQLPPAPSGPQPLASAAPDLPAK